MSLTLTILGCGSSGGVPRVAQGWGACDPRNPRNARRRCSLLVERESGQGRTTALVDTSPDLRAQLIDAEVSRLDGVLITHEHADHTHGIDDLRPIYMAMRRRLDIHVDEPTSRALRAKFAYVFETPPGSGYPPMATEKRLTPGEPIVIEGPGGPLRATGFAVEHGESAALGFRFGDVAYTPDLNGVPAQSQRWLEGLDLWIVDALRYAPHPSHWSLDETLAWIEKLKPRRAVLTNLHTDLDYETLRRRLPEGIEPAYDGMRLEGFRLD
ncbi:MAG: MBL fold metallo-hydrolase [Bradyrhizobium sp.]|nr:MAG: MBL fold metallo-hydrolase [Bradyrhizobium sp.]